MSLRMALLGLLASEGPANGYTLAKSFSGSVSHVWKASHSQIYPELARMSDAGLIEINEEQQPRRAKYYAITAKGRDELERWLMEVEPNRSIRNEIALRSFLLSNLSREKAIILIEREIEYYRERTDKLKELRTMFDNSSDQKFGHLSAELGLRISEAIYGWAKWARSEVEKQKSTGTDSIS